jgi:hypothetical protein
MPAADDKRFIGLMSRMIRSVVAALTSPTVIRPTRDVAR